MLPPPGKHWQYTPERLDKMDARGEIYWSPTGNPRRKVYLDQSPGKPVQDIWLGFRDAHNQNVKITGYPTEKNPELMDRIIQASSNSGDMVLDCFAGSGTMLAAADNLGRQCIGIDNSPQAIATTLKRFAIGAQPMGDFVGKKREATKDGGFPQLALFNLDDNGAQPAEQGQNPVVSPGKEPLISDFSLLCSAGRSKDLTDAVNKWQAL